MKFSHYLLALLSGDYFVSENPQKFVTTVLKTYCLIVADNMRLGCVLIVSTNFAILKNPNVILIFKINDIAQAHYLALVAPRNNMIAVVMIDEMLGNALNCFAWRDPPDKIILPAPPPPRLCFERDNPYAGKELPKKRMEGRIETPKNIFYLIEKRIGE